MNTAVERRTPPLPGGHGKVLLHSGCAPCAVRWSPVPWASRAGRTCSSRSTTAACVRRPSPPGLMYWEYNRRKGGGSARMLEISKRENS